MERAFPAAARRLLTTCLVVAGCAAPTVGGIPPTSATPSPTRAAATGHVVYLRVAGGPTGASLIGVSGDTGEVRVTLPDGVLDPRTETLYAVRHAGGASRVEAFDTRTGRSLRSALLPGARRLPTIGTLGAPRGLTADGRRLVVETETTATTSRSFAILDTRTLEPVHEARLGERFGFDAVSPDGSVLYVVEYLSGDDSGSYRVRAYDVAEGTFREGVIVDKAVGRLLMEGRPVTQTATSDGGLVFTLYLSRTHGPFIHTLDARVGTALCIFLDSPDPLAADGEDEELGTAPVGWAIAIARDEKRVYAANGTLGEVFAIDLSSGLGERPTVTRSVVARAPGDAEASAGKASGTALAVSAKGDRLYLAAPDGLIALDADDLSLLERRSELRGVSSLVSSTGGARLYAVVDDGLRAVAASSGETLASYPVPAGAVIAWLGRD